MAEDFIFGNVYVPRLARAMASTAGFRISHSAGQDVPEMIGAKSTSWSTASWGAAGKSARIIKDDSASQAAPLVGQRGNAVGLEQCDTQPLVGHSCQRGQSFERTILLFFRNG